jgi:hypothetical protein
LESESFASKFLGGSMIPEIEIDKHLENMAEFELEQMKMEA